MVTCTGVSAGWCPIHGDCTCPQPDPCWVNRNDPDCPLHGRASTHGDPDVFPTAWGVFDFEEAYP